MNLLIFLAIASLLFFTNYSPHTYLIGWDNVMPEFNLLANLERSLFGVWQDNRGLGLFDGMSHVANLFHTIYISVISLFVDQSMSRYIFLHLTHLLGGISFFYLANTFTHNRKVSFLGALLYMFNLGIIQLYFAPLEAFAMHFVTLPVIALFTIRAIKKTNRKNLLLLFTAILLTTPQSFIPTLFLVVFILFLSLLAFGYLEKRNFKSSILIFIVFLSANSFWLLPYVQSSIQNANIIKNARINEFSSDDIYYRNKAYGDLSSVIKLKGFMIDAVEYDQKINSNIYFMDAWKKHSQTIPYQFISFLIFFFSLFGILIALKNKNRSLFPYIPPFIIAFFFLANNTFGIEKINTIIRDTFPIVNEAFRFPFTKFITLFAFSLSIFFTFGLLYLFNRFKRLQIPLIIFVLLSLSYISWPAFRGSFFSPLLKLEIPNEYFSVFEYFKNKDSTQRIALLPTHTFWNWQYRSFGQFGSGFIWYGLKQPILERSFDPWSNYNEQFYNEMSYALKLKDKKLFAQVLTKYDISYLLLDKYLISKEGKSINYDEIEDFLSETSVQKEVIFGKLAIYSTNLNNFGVYQLNKEQTIKVYPNFNNEYEDIIYDLYPSDYIVTKNNPNVLPLFPSLYTEKLQKDIEFKFANKKDSISFIPKEANILKGKDNLLLAVPSLFNNEFLIPVNIEIADNNIVFSPLYPLLFINNKLIKINEKPFAVTPQIVKKPKKIVFLDIFNHEIDLVSQNRSYLINNYVNSIILEDDLSQETISIETARNPSTFFLELPKKITHIEIKLQKIASPISRIPENKNSANLYAKNGQKELSFYLNSLFHEQSYVLISKAHYKSGLPLNFYIDNPFQQKPEVQTRLSRENDENILIIPKTEKYFKGYGFHFIAKSIGSEPSETQLENIELYPFPMKTLRNLYIADRKSQLFAEQNLGSGKIPVPFTKINSSLYLSQPLFTETGYLVLSQAFDKGWKAYRVEKGEMKDEKYFSSLSSHLSSMFPFIFGKEIKEHVLVNNWANGWVLDNNRAIVIIFWPQYLEYLGFGILMGTFIWLAWPTIKRSS